MLIKEKKAGGVAFNATCILTKLDEKLVQMILHEYSKVLEHYQTFY